MLWRVWIVIVVLGLQTIQKGVDFKMVEAILACPQVISIKQHKQSFEMKAGLMGECGCLQGYLFFCKAEKSHLFCRVMDADLVQFSQAV